MFLSKVFMLLMVLISSVVHGASQPPLRPADLFTKLSKRADEMYQASSADPKEKPEQPQMPATPQVVTPEPPKEDVKSRDARIWGSDETGKPILGKHKEYSVEWWQELLGDCKGCRNPEEKIDSEKMLDDNQQWKEVAQMSPEGKKIVMKKVLDKYNTDDASEIAPCILACALSAGCNPDERFDLRPNLPDRVRFTHPHTVLHLTASFRPHRGLFSLALKMGANPNLKCSTMYPLIFAPREFEDELRKFGAKKTKDSD